MSTHKNFDKICVVVLALTLLLTLLFINGERLGLQVVVDEDSEAHSSASYFTANDLDGSWDSSGATLITLQGGSASISGSGAYAYNGDVVISSAGLFVLSGSLTDGSVIVDAHSNSKVWLLFNGVELSCSDNACLRVEQADKVFLTLAEGTENSLIGPVVFSGEAEADGTDGVIYAHDDLTINGGGSLSVTAWYRHGIVAKDDLVITGGTITVKAQADGIRANDSLRICNAAITVEAGDDGIVVSGGSAADRDSAYLYIESGSFALTTEDDAISAAGALRILGGDFMIDAVGDGIDSDTSVSIEGGTLCINGCYEGVEAPVISLSGGEVTIYPRDDGFNASASLTSSGLPQVLISGGTLTVINTTATDADGVDSNGDILITGGTVRVSLPGSGTNSALDCGSESGGQCLISGGSVIACGSYSMAEGFDADSEQCSLLYNFSSGAAAGSTVALEDSAGNTLVSWEVPCSFTSVVLSIPEMQLGETYLMVIGDQVEELTLEDVSASYGDAQSQMFSGSMNWGGMQPREDFEGFSGEAPAMGEMPEPPDGDFGGEMSEMGDMPTPPDGDFDGEMPDMSDRPTPPDGGFGGEMPDTAQTPGALQSGAAEVSASSAATVSTEDWLLIGAAALILALGILLGIKYEPKD